jgi:hypothetical protein
VVGLSVNMNYISCGMCGHVNRLSSAVS